MNRLFLIPARGGSKGIQGKNIKLLNGKPLLYYSIELARSFSKDENICVSTDDEAIIKCAAQAGLKVPFIRPADLSGDQASMDGVIQHALDFYRQHDNRPDQLVLLQPTSPCRQAFHLKDSLASYTHDVDMVVSVCKSKANPFYNLFEEDENGLLHICKGDANITSRQEAPPIYIYNGAIYIINADSFLLCKSLGKFRRIRKYVMDEKYSLDIDDENDWHAAEMFFQNPGK